KEDRHMKPSIDPPRLLESSDVEMRSLRGAIASMRDDLPTENDIDDVRQRFAPLFAPPTNGPGGVGTGAVAGVGAALSKAKIAAVVAALVASGSAVGV